jgi:hypothetical protein
MKENTMRAFKLLVPTTLLAAGFLICTTASYGTPEYMKQTKKQCNFCHSQVKPADKELMKKSLTDAGKCFAEHDHKLDPACVK